MTDPDPQVPDAPKPAPPKPAPPKPGPTPGPRPAAVPQPATADQPAAAASAVSAAAPIDDRRSRTFGRVDAQGGVFVRTAAGERQVGTWQAGDADGALDFYTGRFAGMVAEVDLIEQRLRAATIAPDEATRAIRRVRDSLPEAAAVGDFDALEQRLSGLDGLVAEARRERDRARARAQEAAFEAKSALVAEAESLAGSDDWRGGVARFRQLLESWKSKPRLDRRRDDELWHRFSAARTSYTRRRKAHFAELTQRQEQAKVTKEALVTRAQELADSTDWGPTAARLRALMDEWKRAGSAARPVDDALWKRFRAASDRFFTARSKHFQAQDAEYADNASAKEELLAEAEKLVPVTDLAAAKTRLRDIQDRWVQIGKVPRASMRSIDGRLRAVEQAVAEAEKHRWTRSDPEKRARAEATVGMLRKSVEGLRSELEECRRNGDARGAEKAEAGLAAQTSWLNEAEKALADFSG